MLHSFLTLISGQESKENNKLDWSQKNKKKKNKNKNTEKKIAKANRIRYAGKEKSVKSVEIIENKTETPTTTLT